jgi:diguanylate cyclase (GGDEF)-like protein
MIVINPKNISIEQQDAKEKFEQILNVFSTEQEHLKLLIKDWAIWDDTYNFVQNKNEDYIHSNLPENILQDLKLNHLEFFDSNGKSVYSLSDNTISSEKLFQTLHLNQKLNDFGVLCLENHFAFVAIEQIFLSNKEGNSAGFILMLRIIDEKMVQSINKSTDTQIALKKKLSTDENKTFSTKMVDDKTLVIQGNLKSFKNNPPVQLEASIEREFMIQANEIMKNFFLFAIVAGAISFVFSLYSMQINIVSNLNKLLDFISNQRNGVASIPAELIEKKDEIGLITKEFVLLLEQLSTTNAELIRLAKVDMLTGVGNRIAVEEKMNETKKISERKNQILTILLLDIDYFKKYNDTYGHVKGDETLKLVAQTLKNSSMRSGDYFARYGGEEFIGILPDTNQEAAIAIAKRVLQTIQELQIPHKASLLDVKIITASIGSVSIVAKAEYTNEYLVNLADEALYKAKHSGRNTYRCL